MTDCQTHESTLTAYLAGERDESVVGTLIQHSLGCADCRRLLELHRDLCELSSSAPEPDQAEFDSLRERVLTNVAAGRPIPSATRPRATGSLPPMRSIAAIAAALVLFAGGLFVGRALPGDASPGQGGNGSLMNRLVRAVHADAASNVDLSDVEDSRFTYSNVSFRKLGDDRVALDFDLTTHLQLVESSESELLREVLVHSLLNPSTTGTRLKAISLADDSANPKVQDALIFAMRRDPSLAVRLKALTILSDQLHEPTVQDAVLEALRQDESVQVRLVALDYLATGEVAPERIREAVLTNERPGDEALKVRLAEYETRL